jgi:hypothetical protein
MNLDDATNRTGRVFVLVSLRIGLLRSQACRRGQVKTSALASDMTEYSILITDTLITDYSICYSFGPGLKSRTTADAATEPASIGFTSSVGSLPAAPEACS